MKLSNLYSSIFFAVYAVIICNGFDEKCSGKNSTGPCFISIAPLDSMFKKFFSAIDPIVEKQLKKFLKGYEKDASILSSVNSYLLKTLNQPMIKETCKLFSDILTYKFPTVVNIIRDSDERSDKSKKKASGDNDNCLCLGKLKIKLFNCCKE